MYPQLFILMTNNSKKINTDFAVVDLFCGVGGLTQGFVKAQFNVIAGIDFDASCKYAYEKNNKSPFIHADLTKYSPEEIAQLFPEGSIKILAGCAPCQAFSTYQQGNKKNDKWKLLYSFGKIKISETITPPHLCLRHLLLALTSRGGKGQQEKNEAEYITSSACGQ